MCVLTSAACIFRPSVSLSLSLQYDCSCCNRSHALLLYRGVKAAVDDESFSRGCVEALGKLACRVCDPEVGRRTGCSTKCAAHDC